MASWQLFAADVVSVGGSLVSRNLDAQIELGCVDFRRTQTEIEIEIEIVGIGKFGPVDCFNLFFILLCALTFLF